MTDLPQPLTPPDCNLRGLRWMPLDVSRVLDSDLFLMSTGAEFKAAFSLWAKSWSQVPAGSLPNNERILAQLAATKDWKRVRDVALRGWILCADGRLYHPVIAEKALEAMSKREVHVEREENEQSRQQRLRARRKAMFEQLRQHGIVPAYDTKTAELERLIASLPSVTPETQSVTGGDAGDVTGDAPATAKDSTGHNRTVNLNPLNLLSGSPDDAGTGENDQSEIVLDASDPVREVIEYLNARAGTHFRFVESNARLIRGRMKEGASVSDMKAVIDAQNRKWPVGDDMRQYLRPSTLFNATRFEQYLGVLKTSAAGSRSTEHNADSWWHRAGFEFEYEAINAGCSEKYAHLWRDGGRIAKGEAA